MKVHAALFKPDNTVHAIVDAEPAQLNVFARPGWDWRQIPDEVVDSIDVPDRLTLPVHPNRVPRTV